MTIFKRLDFSTVACLPFVLLIALPVPNATPSSSRPSSDLKRRLDKESSNSKNFANEKKVYLAELFKQAELIREVTHAINACVDFGVSKVSLDSATTYVGNYGASLQILHLVPRAGSLSSWTCSNGIFVYNSYGTGGRGPGFSWA